MNNQQKSLSTTPKARLKPKVFQVVSSDEFQAALALLAKKHRCSLSHAARIAVFKAAEEIAA